mmetsp:Transcript_2908/g.11462  ORF Transcript_2908/g.11462 Transcript_2908/m.11462 type:complete len:347 (+) Transcript_2908:2168-3208(+)
MTRHDRCGRSWVDGRRARVVLGSAGAARGCTSKSSFIVMRRRRFTKTKVYESPVANPTDPRRERSGRLRSSLAPRALARGRPRRLRLQVPRLHQHPQVRRAVSPDERLELSPAVRQRRQPETLRHVCDLRLRVRHLRRVGAQHLDLAHRVPERRGVHVHGRAVQLELGSSRGKLGEWDDAERGHGRRERGLVVGPRVGTRAVLRVGAEGGVELAEARAGALDLPEHRSLAPRASLVSPERNLDLPRAAPRPEPRVPRGQSGVRGVVVDVRERHDALRDAPEGLHRLSQRLDGHRRCVVLAFHLDGEGSGFVVFLVGFRIGRGRGGGHDDGATGSDAGRVARDGRGG